MGLVLQESEGLGLAHGRESALDDHKCADHVVKRGETKLQQI